MREADRLLVAGHEVTEGEEGQAHEQAIAVDPRHLGRSVYRWIGEQMIGARVLQGEAHEIGTASDGKQSAGRQPAQRAKHRHGRDQGRKEPQVVMTDQQGADHASDGARPDTSQYPE